MMAPRDSQRARLLPHATLEALDNGLLIQCASYLDAEGLARLGRTSARFGIPQAGQRRSLVNEAAHQLQLTATDEERGCLPKYGDESDIGLYRALEELRRPLCFCEQVGNAFCPREPPAQVANIGRGGWSTAKSGHVMRGGRHYAEFSITHDGKSRHDEQYRNVVHLGVIRPVSLTDGIDMKADWGGHANPVVTSSSYKRTVAEKLRSRRTVKWGEGNVHCCIYATIDGCRAWTDWHDEARFPDWQGSEPLEGSGTVGLLLDLD